MTVPTLLRLARPAQLLAAFALLASSTLAQSSSYDPLSTAPQCAQSCGFLTSAASGCASAGTAGNIAQCFCAAAQPFAAPDNTLCPDCNSASDPSAGWSWFANSLCNNPQAAGQATTTAQSTQASTTAATTTSAQGGGSATISSSALPTGTSTTTGDTGFTSTAATGSWWSLHGRWVIMVIVLLVAFAGIITGGVYWKRRYNRKHNLGDSLPPGAAWGPQQHRSIPGELDGGQSYYEKRPVAERLGSGRVPLAPGAGNGKGPMRTGGNW